MSSESELKARVDELEKKLNDLHRDHHQVISQFTSHVLLQQKQIGSLRGPEGARGEKGEKGDPGVSLSEAEIRQLIEKHFQAEVGNVHKALIAEINKFRTVVDYVNSTSKSQVQNFGEFVGFVGELESALAKFEQAVGNRN